MSNQTHYELNRVPVAVTRKAHYLKPVLRVRTVKHTLCLSVKPHLQLADGSNGRRIQSGLRWQAVGWDAGQPDGEYSVHASGDCQASWWAFLAKVLGLKGVTWLWSLAALDDLTSLGAWEQIERGAWRLDGRDPNYAEGNGQHRRGPWPGQCVIEDTPTIVLMRCVGQPGMVKVLDVRNWGLSGYEAIRRSGHVAYDIGTAVRKIMATAEHLQLGSLRPTAAGQAWHAWRDRYCHEPVLVHTNQDAIDLERRVMIQGRTECYRLGKVSGPIYCLDAQSHYGACAYRQGLPVRLGGYASCTLSDVRHLLGQGYCVIADCLIRTDSADYPLRWRECTVYPIGSYRTALCGPELEHALERNRVDKVIAAAWYAPGQVLDEMVLLLWNWRRLCESQSDVAGAQIAKRLLTGLIGRFAANSWRWVDAIGRMSINKYERYTARHPGGDRLTEWRCIAGHTQYQECQGETQDSTPAIAAWIYSLARLRLLDWIETAGREHVYYVDTDCLWVDTAGYDRLHMASQIKPGALGMLRTKHTWDSVDIRGLKDYIAGGQHVVAGIPIADARETNGHYVWYSRRTAKEAVYNLERPIVEEVQRSVPIARAFRHGIVEQDGHILPFRLNED